jgi:hypothetical protein
MPARHKAPTPHSNLNRRPNCSIVGMQGRVLTKIGVFSQLAGEDFGHPIAQVFEAFGTVAAALFGYAPTLVGNFIERGHYCGPIVVAFQQGDFKTLP